MRRPLSTPTLLAVYMTLLVLLTTTAFTLFFYRFSREKLLEQIDAQLLAAAHFARAALPENFHDGLRDAGSLPAADYARIVERHNRLCAQLNMQYLWSCLVADGRIVFTTATSPSKDIRNNDHAKFFAAHHDPRAFERVFETMAPDYSTFHNEWGRGRMVLVPFRDGLGRPYCFGASMSLNDIGAAQRALLIRTLLLGCGVLVLGLGGTLLLARRLARPIRELTAMAQRITAGHLDEPVTITGREVRALAGELNTMRLAISEKISALRQTADALQESETMLRSFFDSPGMLRGIVELTGDDIRHITDNAVSAAFFGRTQAEMRGRLATELGVPPEIVQQWVGHYAACRQSGQPVSFTYAHQTPTGEKWFEAMVSYLGEHTPGRPRFAYAINDITTVKQLEAQLVQAQKMEAIGQLAGGVAHDFNNILQAINGYTELAQDDIGAGHPAVASLGEVASAAARASKLVGQLLAFSRRQIMTPVHLDLNAVLAQLVSMLRRVIGTHIHLELVPAPELGTVRADRTMIEQVLLNLAVNARDAMPQGGRLTLRTENVSFDEAFCRQQLWARPGRYALVSVTDTGCGMDAHTLDHIFEPFFTTKDTGKGTGLGLSMVYGIVQQHGGLVRVQSQPGQGATFSIYLPIVERPADAVASQPETEPPRGTETILVAEDNPGVRKLTCLTLERAGYTVLAAEDGAAALALFEKNAARVQLLLFDVMMPNLDGCEAYDRIHAQRPQLPVLFASGYSEDSLHTNFVLQEGMKLIGKPYRAGELLRLIRQILDGAAAR